MKGQQFVEGFLSIMIPCKTILDKVCSIAYIKLNGGTW